MKWKFYYRFGTWFEKKDMSIPLLPSIDLGILQTPPKAVALRVGWLGVYLLFGLHKKEDNGI